MEETKNYYMTRENFSDLSLRAQLHLAKRSLVVRVSRKELGDESYVTYALEIPVNNIESKQLCENDRITIRKTAGTNMSLKGLGLKLTYFPKIATK